MTEFVNIRDMHHVPVGELESPAFLSPHPQVRHLELVPTEIHNAMRPAWETGTFGLRHVSIDKVFDVMVTAEGLVFSHDRKIITQTITQHSAEDCIKAFEAVSNVRDPVVIDTSCVLMRKRGDHNYGHWLIEVLPKLRLARSVCHVSGMAIPADVGQMKRVIDDTLAISDDIGTTPRFALERGQVTLFKELIIVSGASEHGSYMSPLVVEQVERLAQHIDGAGLRKIYVSRRGSPRNLLDEDLLEEKLKSRGFYILHPERLSFAAQVSAFKDADTIIGVMGAGMTNLVFAPQAARIINLSPATMPDTFFYFLAIHKQHDYREVRGANANGSRSWDDKFKVDVEEVLDELR